MTLCVSTIRDCYATGNTTEWDDLGNGLAADGGGFYVLSGLVFALDSMVSRCFAAGTGRVYYGTGHPVPYGGGGVCAVGGSILLSGSLISDCAALSNKSTACGGGVCTKGPCSFTLTWSFVRNCTTSGGRELPGGGGGVCAYGGEVMMLHSITSDCISSGDSWGGGSGIYAHPGWDSSGLVMLYESTIRDCKSIFFRAAGECLPSRNISSSTLLCWSTDSRW